jgi:hypothetical protein
MTYIISINGNISSGKSLIINNLKNQFINEDYIIFIENPIIEYKDILKKFYDCPVKYAFSFQIMILIKRFYIINETIKKNPNSIIITEGDIYTDKYIFAKMLFESNKMNTFEYEIYNKLFNEFKQQINSVKHKYIYISSDPICCFEKNKNNIDITYLKLYNQYHEEMLNKLSSTLIINSDDLFSSKYNKTFNEIRTFILQHQIKKHNIELLLVCSYSLLCFIIYLILKYLF